MIGVGPWRIVEGKSKKKSEGMCLGRSWVSNCYKSILAAGAIALSVTLSGGAMFASWKLLSSSHASNFMFQTWELSLEIWRILEFGEICKLNRRIWRNLQTQPPSVEKISKPNLGVWRNLQSQSLSCGNIFKTPALTEVQFGEPGQSAEVTWVPIILQTERCQFDVLFTKLISCGSVETLVKT